MKAPWLFLLAAAAVPAAADGFLPTQGGALSPASSWGTRGASSGIARPLVRTRGGGGGGAPGAASSSSLGASSSTAASTLLGDNARVLDDELLKMAEKLVGELGQEHLVASWPPAGEKDEEKKNLIRQAMECDASYPGGLSAYISKARQLLKESADGVNPFEGYTPRVPDGESLMFGTPEYEEAEKRGLEVAGDTAFVLVAGGLGERLGYSGIKLALPVEVTTRKTYLELYCEYILALQARANGTRRQIPLIIMTSQDTDAATRSFLTANNNFGMSANQIRIIMQDKVPALADSQARLALSSGDPFEIETKPHGHGDVHHLLFREGIASELEEKGYRYLFFLQDTNALVINSILPALGVSSARGYHMNSICVPRKAKEAAGAITLLTRDDGSSIVINVEYNQLDPLLRATTSPDGDANDPSTGFSPFPGNVNTLVMELNAYNRVLGGPDKGVVTEFVNPKYKDDTRTSFKKPTRLECMMQDFPKLMQKELGSSACIGFTSLEKWLAFSPAKNSLDAGAASAAQNVPPGTASSAESEFYAANAQKLAMVTGAKFGESKTVTFKGVPCDVGPRIVSKADWALTTADLRERFSSNVSISNKSTLVLNGRDIVVESLELDGTLVVNACPGASVALRGLKVKNNGWSFEELGEIESASEEDAIRGYILKKDAALIIDITESGSYVVGAAGDITKVSSI